ncbi:MAG: hypothetical protein DRP26_01180 [Candidatus Zixiibacteriota bacterium]|nr:MAG: hypothetical protein DRP26_01180 [candidate division Zixibacteria bacterium]
MSVLNTKVFYMKLLKYTIIAYILAHLQVLCWSGTISPQLQKKLTNSNPSDMHKVILVMAKQANIYALNQQLTLQRATLAQRNYQVITSLQEVATRTQQSVIPAMNELEAYGKIQNIKRFWLVNLIAVEATKEAIMYFANLEEIEKITLDYRVELTKPVEEHNFEKPDRLHYGHEIGLERIHAPQAWAMGYTGAGRLVSHVDTGVDGYHPALADRFRGDVDDDGDCDESWFDPNGGSGFPTDYSDHGTHTMGIICGRTPDGDTIGVAIDASWISTSPAFYGSHEQFISTTLMSLEWIVDPDDNPTTQDNPDVCGNSWGIPDSWEYPDCDETFWNAIDNCEAAGTVIIFSAGDEGFDGLRSPADRATTYYNVFSVGAVDGNEPSLPIDSQSARGPTECATGDLAIKPEVVAPGVNVRSSVPGGDYSYKSGTSIASPYIAGAVAVIRQVNPNLDANTIKDILMLTAEDLGTPGEDNDYGHGIINLYRACILAEGFGYVDGYITDINTSNPLQAHIRVVDGQAETYANISGYFRLGLPADTTFTLEASYYGYLPQQQSIYITAGDTAHQDFALTPATPAILQGTVTSVIGDSIDGAEVNILDTPIPPETTDTNGFYQFLAVPSGSSYRVQVIAIGYSRGLDSIFIQDGATNILDFSITPAETFEYSNGDYSGEGVWQWGEPTYGPPCAWSGTKVWGTILDGEYPDNADDNLTSPDMFLALSEARLEFYHWYDIENGWDGGNVSISTDDGNSWTLISPDGGYPDHDIYALNEPGYTGSSNGWIHASFDISVYYNHNVMFRWRFGSDYHVNKAGWYIDDVVVIGTILPEPPELSYNPTSFNVTTQPGNIETRELFIINNGNSFLFFNLLTETFDPLCHNAKQEITSLLHRPGSVGYYKVDTEKASATDKSYSPPITTGQGGPDNFGYGWIDSDEPNGPVYNWIDISEIGTPIVLGMDDYEGPISIGFAFPFYENDYVSLYICSSGMLSFGSGSTSYNNTYIPNPDYPNNMIAIWWDDLDPSQAGAIYYYNDSFNNRFIVSFIEIPNYNDTGSSTFQAILYPSGEITLQYSTMDPGSDDLQNATIGIENIDGSDGLEILYNAPYMHNNLAIYIQPSWLLVSPTTGIVDAHDSSVITVTFDATMLNENIYTGNINLISNDPVNPDVDIPVIFSVSASGTPELSFSADGITDSLYEDSLSVHDITIYNSGEGLLFITFSSEYSWIGFDGGPYYINPADSAILQVTLDATDLSPGDYSGSINFNSNDPDTISGSIPVTLTVMPLSPGCDYVPGDINGDGDVMGNDVTFGVRYFKGLGLPPPDSCLDDSLSTWLYAAGDVNGNCSFTGSDISFLVAYYKAYNPEILFCHRTPPLGYAHFSPEIIKIGKNHDFIKKIR